MENEIELVKDYKGKVMTSSLVIADVFGKNHRDFMRKVREKYDLFGERKIAQSSYINSQNKEQPMFMLDRDATTYFIMGFTGNKADEWKLKYIDAFNKMEKALQEQNKMALPTTYKEALIQLLETVEKNEQLEAERQVLLPKADYHDEVLNKEGLITTTIIAKDLGFTSAAKLNQILFINKIIYKDKNGTWMPYRDYEFLIEDGYADYRSYEDKHAKPTLKWTEKGRKWIAENIEKFKEVVDNM